MSTSSVYVIPTDEASAEIISGLVTPSFQTSALHSGPTVTVPSLITPGIDVSIGYTPPPAPIVQDFNPGTGQESDLAAMPAFFGGIATDIFTGQSGDPQGNFGGVAGNYNFSLVSTQAYGGSDWMTVGTDLNNGSETKALADMSAAIQSRMNGLPLATPPGNVAAGLAELTISVGAWCPLAVGAAALGGAATMSKFKGSKTIALMAFSAVGVAVAKCEAIVANPDANEMAAYDAILHTAYVSTQAIEADFGTIAGGGANALKSIDGSGSTSTSTTTGWNLTSTGATVDWTKSFIDPVTHAAVNLHT